MVGFYVILTIAILYIAFMSGVLGYLIGKYGYEVAYENRKHQVQGKATQFWRMV